MRGEERTTKKNHKKVDSHITADCEQNDQFMICKTMRKELVVRYHDLESHFEID